MALHFILLLAASGFTASERVVSNPAVRMPDMEFDSIAFRITWQDTTGNLWVTNIDPLTGDFNLTGQILIDTGLPPIPSYRNGTGSGDGPEWIFTADGEDILYTKSLGQPQTRWQVYRASLTGGVWQGAALPQANQLSYGPYGDAPYGSQVPGDPNPRLSFFVPPSNAQGSVMAWRKLEQPDGAVVSNFATSAGRWATYDSTQICYTRKIGGINQGFVYDAVHLIEKQVTFSSSVKSYPALWLDPLTNQPMFSVVQALGSQQMTVGIYSLDDQGNWYLYNTIRPPSTQSKLRMARASTYNGESYITVIADSTSNSASEIWLCGVRPDIPFYREVSVHSVSMVRNDPEFVALSSGAFVYFSDSRGAVIYQSPTGLGPPATNIIRGTNAADTLKGTSGNDLITGDGGADLLTGGAGSDQFAYESINDAGDTIKDFKVGKDLIVINLLLAEVGYQGTNPLQDGYITFAPSASGKDTLIYLDTDGNAGPATPILYITVKNVTPHAMGDVSNFVY